ncbi:MAG: hypothetical protein Kow00122_10830 [Thermoleophilia bacterium]
MRSAWSRGEAEPALSALYPTPQAEAQAEEVITIILKLLSENILVGSLVTILALIVVDVVTSVAVAPARGPFTWAELHAFLQTNVVPYMLAWGAVEALRYTSRYTTFPDAAVAPFAGAGALICALIIGRLVGSIIGNLRELGISTEQAGATKRERLPGVRGPR